VESYLLQNSVQAVPSVAAPALLGAEAGFAESVIAGTMQQLIDELPEEIALLDEQFNVLSTNRVWRETAAALGYPLLSRGDNYYAFCAERAGEGFKPAMEAVAALRSMFCGVRDEWELFYESGSARGEREFRLRVRRLSVRGVSLIMVTRTDLTEMFELRRAKQTLIDSLADSQAEERQRIARELHDSTSQLLVAIGLLLGRVRCSGGDNVPTTISEIEDLLAQAHREIRTLSFLAVPPALDHTDLRTALQSLLHGFSRRADLGCTFNWDGDASGIGPDESLALYRVAQEALTNIHRHSSASNVSVKVYVRRFSTHLVITDDGVGVPESVLRGEDLGVGIAGMRRRLAEMGGRLSVRRLLPGTALVATLRNISAPRAGTSTNTRHSEARRFSAHRPARRPAAARVM
jgi:signal transduction histidine kinase